MGNAKISFFCHVPKIITLSCWARDHHCNIATAHPSSLLCFGKSTLRGTNGFSTQPHRFPSSFKTKLSIKLAAQFRRNICDKRLQISFIFGKFGNRLLFPSASQHFQSLKTWFAFPTFRF